jgi:hypothetical protein
VVLPGGPHRRPACGGEGALAACLHAAAFSTRVEGGNSRLPAHTSLPSPPNTAPQRGQAYDRDLFLFIFLVLTIVAFSTSLQPVRTPLLLNRPQTEEWKGWMQVLFLLYHYFEAKEAYNAIRIFIAGYVWMTGFGNFSYYYRTGDFGIGR